jgi:membrane fusion protein, copper/silver efflux system
MNKALLPVAALILAASGGAAGYWWGARSIAADATQETAATPRASAGISAAAAAGAVASNGGRRVLFYRNPMGLPDTSPVPKKDPMGMDYVPVYEGEEPEGPGVKISLDRMQRLGVVTEAAAMRNLARTIRATGTLEIDERALRSVSPRFEGYIQRLYVNATGQYVQRGQPLMEVYSPDLLAAQQEFIVATRGVAMLKEASPDVQANMRDLVEASLQRLRNWDIDAEEVARLRSEGRARQEVTLRSPASGVVIEKPAVQGMRFMPGEALYKIADLSSIWLIADIFEQDMGLVRQGQPATIRVAAYPERVFQGKVSFIYPTVTAETRTAKVRIELRNSGNLLKPAMYASVELASSQGRRLTVPDSAVLDSGPRQIVLVQRGEGLFEPRDVNLGQRGDGHVEVVQGIKAGEEVVVSANFLIDAESNLRAAVAAFGSSAPPAPGAVADGAKAKAANTHAAEGRVEAVDRASGSASIAHGPVPSLNWPGMSMEFKVKDAKLLESLKPGATVRFEFGEQAPGEWTIVRVSPVRTAAAGGRTAAGAHEGH